MPERSEPFPRTELISFAAESLLEAGAEALADSQRDVPERRFVAFGQPVHDCEQLTVTLIQAYVGPPGDQAEGPQPCSGPYSAVFQLQLARKVPVANVKTRTAPDKDELNDHSLELYRDTMALLLTPEFMDMYIYGRATIASVSMGEPQGAYIPIILDVVVGLG